MRYETATYRVIKPSLLDLIGDKNENKTKNESKELEKIPVTGDTMEWKMFKFEIVDMDNHRIDKVLVSTDEKIEGE